jgi:raffinose/stachyose/melibiose transport system permease protein
MQAGGLDREPFPVGRGTQPVVSLEAPGEVILIRPAHGAPDAADRLVGMQEQDGRVLGAQLAEVGHGRQSGGRLEEPDEMAGGEMQLAGQLREGPLPGEIRLKQAHRAPGGRPRRPRPIESPAFGMEVKNLGILVGGGILITLVSQFTAAEVVMHMPKRAATIARYVLVLPIVLPPLVLIEVWAYLLQPGTGLIDRTLGVAGLPQPTWLSDPHLALLSILLVGFPWISNLGFLIFLGGLQNLPRDVLDAARLDGLGAIRRVFAIDVPLLLPQFRVVVILSGINAVQNFVPILLLTSGGPGTATLVPGLDMYQSAFQSDQYGYGMAIGTLLFIAMLIFTLVVMRALRSRTT